MSTSVPEIARRLVELLDAIDEPVSVASAIRDRDGRILDFRIEADTVTGGSWVGGLYDLRAIRLGDGYLSTWRLRSSSPEPA